jgi:riboflavin kinase/FMN adenylyltransferase
MMIKVFNNIDNVEFNQNTIVTVGTFDGVHLGHKEILAHLIQESNTNNKRSCIVTFHPHPQHIIQSHSKKDLKLLTSIEERIYLFDKLGINSTLVIPFNREFSQLSAEEFILDILYKKLGFSDFLIGYDHSFGRNREGNYSLLKSLSEKYNFNVTQIGAKTIDNSQIISSTKIREALENRDIKLANKMLGWNYFITGIVREGHKRGRTIGFPTANVIPEEVNKLIPRNGVYVVKSNIDGVEYFGMANIGTRPTFLENAQALLEVHFFDLNMDLYGKELRVEFLSYVREEKKFEVIDKLVNQLKDDKQFSLDFLKDYKI